MDIFTAKRVDECPEVERGGVYEFLEKDGTCNNKYAIVVGADYRRRDRYVSIITLSEGLNDGFFRRDAIGIQTPIGDFMVHCGMITYLRRDRLGKMIHRVSKKARSRINTLMSFELGITDRPGNYDLEEDNKEPDYKLLYNNLLNKIAKEAQKNK